MYSTSPPLSIQRSGQSWLLGVPPSKVLYASPQSGTLPLSGWTIRAGGGEPPAPTIERADAPPAEVLPSGALCRERARAARLPNFLSARLLGNAPLLLMYSPVLILEFLLGLSHCCQRLLAASLLICAAAIILCMCLLCCADCCSTLQVLELTVHVHTPWSARQLHHHSILLLYLVLPSAAWLGLGGGG